MFPTYHTLLGRARAAQDPKVRCTFLVAAIAYAADLQVSEGGDGHRRARIVTLEVGADPGTLVVLHLTTDDGTRLDLEGQHFDQVAEPLADLARHPHEDWAALCARSDDELGVYELDVHVAAREALRLLCPWSDLRTGLITIHR
ncbi:hypothetical protein [Streptomyces sp. NBRC 110465]|uniref:hypothetical protein n=1 Tax=Streptomyces sp. NBRC 110465 TaxID=1897621 RepID=UPI0009350BD7|nr:hypothetical protein [Streptomyces sp. NBRC 110465]